MSRSPPRGPRPSPPEGPRETSQGIVRPRTFGVSLPFRSHPEPGPPFLLRRGGKSGLWKRKYLGSDSGSLLSMNGSRGSRPASETGWDPESGAGREVSEGNGDWVFRLLGGGESGGRTGPGGSRSDDLRSSLSRPLTTPSPVPETSVGVQTLDGNSGYWTH